MKNLKKSIDIILHCFISFFCFSLIFLLSSCNKTGSSENLDNRFPSKPEGFKDCKVGSMTDAQLNTITVVRCPHSTTTTYHDGTTSLDAGD